MHQTNFLLSPQAKSDSFPSAPDRSALNRFITEYYDLVVNVARRNLKQFPESAFDAEDVAISAFGSLMKHVNHDSDGELLDRSELVRLLFVIARNKVCDAVRRETAKKRGFNRRFAFDFSEPTDPTEGPDTACILRDLFAELLRRLPVELRQVAELKFRGYTNAEVAAELDVADRTVERRLQRISEYCVQLFS